MEEHFQVSGMMYKCKPDVALSFTYVDNGAEEVSGYTPSELIDTGQISLPDLIHPEDRDRVRGSMQAGITEKRSFIIPCRLQEKKGSFLEGIILGAGIFKGTLTLTGLEGYIIRILSHASTKDIPVVIKENFNSTFKNPDNGNKSDVKRYLKLIKDILLKKQDDTVSDHYMKYNILLLDLEMLVLQNLNDNSSGLYTKKYLADLSDLIKKAYFDEMKNIGFSIRIISDNLLSGYEAMCLGIIAFEQCINIFEYAFYPGQKGVIEFSFSHEEGWNIFQIKDNGKGFSDSEIKNVNFSDGFALIEKLSKEISGTVNRSNNNGATVKIIFPAG
jgi:hypothetical protein